MHIVLCILCYAYCVMHIVLCILCYAYCVVHIAFCILLRTLVPILNAPRALSNTPPANNNENQLCKLQETSNSDRGLISTDYCIKQYYELRGGFKKKNTRRTTGAKGNNFLLVKMSHLSLPVIICHYMSLYVTICNYLSLSVTFCYYQSLSVNISHY